MKTPSIAGSECGPNRSIDIATLSLESDTSAHSYALEDIVVNPRGHTAPLGGESVGLDTLSSEVVPSTSIARSAFANYRDRMGGRSSPSAQPAPLGLPPPPPTPDATPQPSGALSEPLAETPSEQLRRRLRGSVRMSIQLPRGMESATLDALAESDAQAKLVRRRRRLPLSLIIFFGCVSCYCAVVGTLALCFGAYNFSKIRLNRGTDAITRLREALMPILNEIRDRLDAGR